MAYIAVIGLEFHCEMKSHTKVFSNAINGYSKLSNQYVKHPSDLFSVGDIVDCWVDDISLEKNKVSLSLIER